MQLSNLNFAKRWTEEFYPKQEISELSEIGSDFSKEEGVDFGIEGNEIQEHIEDAENEDLDSKENIVIDDFSWNGELEVVEDEKDEEKVPQTQLNVKLI